MTRDFSLPEAAPPATIGVRSAGRRPRTAAVVTVVGATTLLAIVLGGVAILRSGASARPAAAVAGTVTAPALEPARAPCPGRPADAPAGAVAVAGDPAGAGCTTPVLWWPDRAEVDVTDDSGARHRFALGQPGDQLVLGDWDDDGRDTPALYDPGTGTVTRFDGWADADEPISGTVVTTDAPVSGIARVVRIAGGPDQIDVDPVTP